MNQLRVPRAGEAQRLRKAGAAVFHESVERLAHEQRRDAEPRFLFQIALHAVAQDGGFARRENEIWVPPASQRRARRLGRVGSGRIDDLDSVVPGGRDLLDFFFQRHARKQVGDAVIDGQSGVRDISACPLRRGLRGFVLSGELRGKRAERDE